MPFQYEIKQINPLIISGMKLFVCITAIICTSGQKKNFLFLK